MCHRKATSKEHVPPKGFFPDEMRKNLITVPSCDVHNNKKTGDDEWLMILISTSIATSDLARDKIFPKLKRGISKSPGKLGIFKNLSPITVDGVATGAFEIDTVRIRATFAAIAKGLYFHTFHQKFLENVGIFLPPTGVIKQGNDEASRGVNQANQTILDKTEGEFLGVSREGSHHSVFYYQWLVKKDFKLLRLTFFDGFIATAYFSP